MLESALETKFSRLVKARRGLAFKLAPTMKGLPDRLVVMPGGRLYLVELKTEVGKRSPAQVLLHSRLAALGVEVVTLYGPSQIEAWVESVPRVTEPGRTDQAEVWLSDLLEAHLSTCSLRGVGCKFAEAVPTELQAILDRRSS